jgi:hypothetical protein
MVLEVFFFGEFLGSLKYFVKKTCCFRTSESNSLRNVKLRNFTPAKKVTGTSQKKAPTSLTFQMKVLSDFLNFFFSKTMTIGLLRKENKSGRPFEVNIQYASPLILRSALDIEAVSRNDPVLPSMKNLYRNWHLRVVLLMGRCVSGRKVCFCVGDAD